MLLEIFKMELVKLTYFFKKFGFLNNQDKSFIPRISITILPPFHLVDYTERNFQTAFLKV